MTDTAVVAEPADRELCAIAAAWTVFHGAADATAKTPATMLDALLTAASIAAADWLLAAFPGLVTETPSIGFTVSTWHGEDGEHLEIVNYDGSRAELSFEAPTAVAAALADGAVGGDGSEWRTDDGTLAESLADAESATYYREDDDGREHSATVRPDGVTVLQLNDITVNDTRNGLTALATRLTDPAA